MTSTKKHLALASASELSLPALAELFTQSFTDYVVDVQISAESLSSFIRTDGVDLHESRVLREHSRPVGLVLIAPRGWSTRIAAMGIVASRRGQGHGALLLDTAVETARRRGSREILLEVIEQNEPAVNLYRGRAFQTIRRLLGFTRAAQAELPRDPDLSEVDPSEAARVITSHGNRDLPFQITGESLTHLAPPHFAFRRDSAWAIVSGPRQDPMVLQALFVETSSRNRGQGRRMIEALVAAFPNLGWRIPARIPEEYSGFLSKTGWEIEEISQFQMRLSLGTEH